MARLLLFLLIGLSAGWIAGQLLRGRSLGIGTNLFVGVVGSLFGGFLFNLVGLYAYGFLGSLVMAVAGSMALLSVMMTMKRKL
jgi:uncharacterized membrane protein YeaQ/YmgE (transglycosylase-associated protein family)